MALDFVKNQISCFQFTSVVVDIFDRYDIQNSIKKAERDLRFLLIQFVRIQCMQNYAGIRLFLCACQTTVQSNIPFRFNILTVSGLENKPAR
jgi:hypothetical protein